MDQFFLSHNHVAIDISVKSDPSSTFFTVLMLEQIQSLNLTSDLFPLGKQPDEPCKYGGAITTSKKEASDEEEQAILEASEEKPTGKIRNITSCSNIKA